MSHAFPFRHYPACVSVCVAFCHPHKTIFEASPIRFVIHNHKQTQVFDPHPAETIELNGDQALHSVITCADMQVILPASKTYRLL
jgi:hypothetical protein